MCHVCRIRSATPDDKEWQALLIYVCWSRSATPDKERQECWMYVGFTVCTSPHGAATCTTPLQRVTSVANVI